MTAVDMALAHLINNGPASAPAVSAATGRTVKAVAKALMNLRQMGLIEPMGRIPRTAEMKGRGNTPMLWRAIDVTAPAVSILESAIRNQPPLATVWSVQPEREAA